VGSIPTLGSHEQSTDTRQRGVLVHRIPTNDRKVMRVCAPCLAVDQFVNKEIQMDYRECGDGYFRKFYRCDKGHTSMYTTNVEISA
jgi:hypothetical protein